MIIPLDSTFHCWDYSYNTSDPTDEGKRHECPFLTPEGCSLTDLSKDKASQFTREDLEDLVMLIPSCCELDELAESASLSCEEDFLGEDFSLRPFKFGS